MLAGEFAGNELNKIGAKHTLCVLHAQGQIQLEDRCAGIKSKFSGATENLYANGTDIPSTSRRSPPSCRQDPTIDSVVTLGASLAVAVQQQLEQDQQQAPRSSPTRSTTT